MAQQRDENPTRIARIYCNGANLLPVSYSQVLPRLPAVNRFVNTIARREVRPLQSFATPNIDSFGIGRGNCQRTDRSGWLIIKDRSPGVTVVTGLPHAAVIDTNIKDTWLARNSGSTNGSSTAKWPNHAPSHFLVELRSDLLCWHIAMSDSQE